MIQKDIFKQINYEIDDFKTNTIKITDGYNFNTYKLINKITLYINSKFESGDRDSTGRKKFFYNIVLFRKDVTKRLIDIDVKDFRFFSKTTLNQAKALFLEHAFKNWARENNFGYLLNEISEQIVVYGTAFLKITKDLIPSVVNIHNLFFDQGAKDIKNSNYVIEKILLNPVDLLEKIEDGWDEDEVKNLLDNWEKSGEQFIEVYERQGIVPVEWINKKNTKKNKKYTKALFIVSFLNSLKNKNKSREEKEGVILYKQEIDDYNYIDFAVRRQKGRLLGVGDVELLLDAQVRRNYIVNQKATAMEISSKHLFVTPDASLSGSNFLSDYVDGTILQGQGLAPVATENRDISTWASEEAAWDILADRLTSTYDVIRGESLPATTPATNALIQKNQALSNFTMMKQNFGLALESFITKYLMPKLINKFNAKDILQIIVNSFEDLEQIDAFIINELKKKFIFDYILKTGFYPEEEDLIRFEERVKKEISLGGLSRIIKYGKNYFKDFEYQIIVNVSSESMDPAAEIINLQNFMNQIINPQVLNDPILRKFIFKIAEKIGIPIVELQRIEEAKAIKSGQQTNEGINEEMNQELTKKISQEILNQMSIPQNTNQSQGQEIEEEE